MTDAVSSKEDCDRAMCFRGHTAAAVARSLRFHKSKFSRGRYKTMLDFAIGLFIPKITMRRVKGNGISFDMSYLARTLYGENFLALRHRDSG